MVRVTRAVGLALRIMLGAGIWLAANLIIQNAYVRMVHMVPGPPFFAAMYLPMLAAAVAYLWVYWDVKATGRGRYLLTATALLAHGVYLAYVVGYLRYPW